MSDEQARTEVVPEVVFLGKLVERVADGKIRAPRFQRAFVWNQADLHALLDSVLRGFPIGSILVWDTEETIETANHMGPVEVGPRPAGLVGYLLDGQQRVSALVGTLQLPDGVGIDRRSNRLVRVLRLGKTRVPQGTQGWNRATAFPNAEPA